MNVIDHHLLHKFVLNPAGLSGVLILSVLLALLASCDVQAAEFARKQIKIVGSTTVYPHAKKVAETFARLTKNVEPEIKGTGSGGGLKLLCAGIGEQYPDISNASRPMKRREWELCKSNGIDSVTEIRFGRDGLALVESIKEEILDLTSLELYKALAAWLPIDGKLVKNPYRNWRQISPHLPKRPIQIYGYGKGHGAYHILTRYIMHPVCRNQLDFFRSRRLRLDNERKFKTYLKAKCSSIRTDGVYIAADQRVGQVIKLINGNSKALAILGYSNVFPNRDKMQAVSIDGVEPRIYTISDGSYAMSRPLFFYIKNAHRKKLPGMNLYIKEFMSERAMGSLGYLASRGLGTLQLDELKNARYAAAIGRNIKRFDEGSPKKSLSSKGKKDGSSLDGAGRNFTIVGWGGSTQAAYRDAFFDPFTKQFNVEIKEDSWNGEMSKIRFMNETGRVVWDVVQVEEPEVLMGCDEGLFERLDWKRIAGGKKTMIEGAALECGAGVYVWSTVFAYDRDKIVEGPKNWAEFWDTQKWPGKRGLRFSAKITLEIALMADGVKPGNVYKLLKTKKGVDRAFKKLDELKPHIVWWNVSSAPSKILAQGSVVMTTGYNARLYNSVKNDGKNFEIVWQGNHYSMDYWAIVKGSKHVDEAYKFISLYNRPARQARYFNKISYGWTVKGAGLFVNAQMKPHLPTTIEHLRMGLLTDADFWLDNGRVLSRRFKAWARQ